MRYNRWVVLYGCLAVQLVVGTLYGWGNDTVYITSWLRKWNPDLLYRDTLFTLGSSTIGLSFGGLAAGMMVDRYPNSMRVMVTLTSVLFCGAVALTTQVRSLWQLLLVTGVVRGMAMGAAHVGPLIIGQKWFPDHLNMVNGVTAAALGMSSFVFNFVTTQLINPDNLSRESDEYGFKDRDGKWYFKDDSPVVDRVVPGLLILSAIYFVLSVPGGLLSVSPDRRGYLDLDAPQQTGPNDVEGDERGVPGRRSLEGGVGDGLAADPLALAEPVTASQPPPRRPNPREGGHGGHGPVLSGDLLNRYKNYTVREALCSWHLYYLCVLFMLTSMPGHVVFAVYKTYAREMDDRFLTLVGSIGALGNTAGRIFWGAVADFLGRYTDSRGEKWTLAIMMLIQSGFLATFGLPAILDNKPTFLIWTLLVKTCYGGCFSIFPSLTCKMYGIGNFGTIYGLVLFAWGAAGITGDALVNVVEDHLSATAFFLLFACVSFGGLLLSAVQQYPEENDPSVLKRLSMKLPYQPREGC